MEDRYITIKAAATILGVTPLTLRNWDRKQLLVAYRNPLNNYRLYLHSEVANLIARIRETAPIHTTAQTAAVPASLPESLVPPTILPPLPIIQKLEVKFLDDENDLTSTNEV